MKWTRPWCAGLALMLSACAVSPAVVATPPPVSEPAPPVVTADAGAVLKAERAFAAAEIEWQSAIAVGRVAVARGLIRGTTATTVRQWNASARAAIVAGKAAVDIAGKAKATADLLRLTGLLDRITGRK